MNPRMRIRPRQRSQWKNPRMIRRNLPKKRNLWTCRAEQVAADLGEKDL